MGPLGVVELSPGSDLVPGVVQAQEPVLVEALLPQAAVEGFNGRILRGLAQGDEVNSDVVFMAQLRNTWLRNSGPLSTRRRCGQPL